MTVEVTHNPDGSVTLTVGGWVGPDPERIEAALRVAQQQLTEIAELAETSKLYLHDPLGPEYGLPAVRTADLFDILEPSCWCGHLLSAHPDCGCTSPCAYPVGPVLTLTAEEWRGFVDGIKAQAQREVADALIRMGPTRRTYNRGVSDWIHERIADGGFDENPNLRGITIPESVCLTCADQWFECPDCGGTRHRARGGFDD